MSEQVTTSDLVSCPGLVSALPAERDREPQQPGAEPPDRLMLQSILNEAFNQYIFTRVDNILKQAETNDADYRETVSKVGSLLTRLLKLAGKLEAQYPELIGLVMELESYTALESGQSAEIAYKQGLRDSGYIHKEFMAFQQQR